MSGGPATTRARLNNNSGIKFAPGSDPRGPNSASSQTLSEKSVGSANVGTQEKSLEDLNRQRRPSSYSDASSGQPAQHDMVQSRSARNPVRTIPVWVRSAGEDDLEREPPSDYFLPNSPRSAFVAQHNSSPWTKFTVSAEHPENFPDGDALLPGRHYQGRRSRWISFAQPSRYAAENWQGEKVKPEWLNERLTDYSKPWLADHNDDDFDDGSGRYHAFKRKRKTWYKRAQQTFLRNPMIPLVFRMTVFLFSAVALALAASIHRESDVFSISKGPSSLMAIIVDVVSLVYILYITYDEYTGKPLGLRPAKAKLRILLLDLFFIVFQAANLSLAFQTLTDPGEACRPATSGRGSDAANTGICRKQKGLATVILIALIAWLNTFCVSILRLVERVSQ